MEHPSTKVINQKPEIPQQKATSKDVNKNVKDDANSSKEVKSESKGKQEVVPAKDSKKVLNNSTTPRAAENTEKGAPANLGDTLIGPASLNPATPIGLSAPPPAAPEPAGMVEMGGGLPALPPRPVAPIRQAMPSASASSYSNALPQRVPNLKQVSKPQFNIPPGSDLGAVGKIGVYQMSHKSSATDIHANLIFWIYIVTFITTYFLIKRK